MNSFSQILRPAKHPLTMPVLPKIHLKKSNLPTLQWQQNSKPSFWPQQISLKIPKFCLKPKKSFNFAMNKATPPSLWSKNASQNWRNEVLLTSWAIRSNSMRFKSENRSRNYTTLYHNRCGRPPAAAAGGCTSTRYTRLSASSSTISILKSSYLR